MNHLPEERDPEVDWLIAQKVKGASEKSKAIWEDYSPTTDAKECMRFIFKYEIDVRYFDPRINPDLNPNEPWQGGLQYSSQGIMQYYTAWGANPMIASMRALARCLEENDIWK